MAKVNEGEDRRNGRPMDVMWCNERKWNNKKTMKKPKSVHVTATWATACLPVCIRLIAPVVSMNWYVFFVPSNLFFLLPIFFIFFFSNTHFLFPSLSLSHSHRHFLSLAIFPKVFICCVVVLVLERSITALLTLSQRIKRIKPMQNDIYAHTYIHTSKPVAHYICISSTYSNRTPTVLGMGFILSNFVYISCFSTSFNAFFSSSLLLSHSFFRIVSILS